MKPVRKKDKGEHVLPLALGGSLIIDRVCLDCDNKSGAQIDAGLINLAAIHQRRVELGPLWGAERVLLGDNYPDRPR